MTPTAPATTGKTVLDVTIRVYDADNHLFVPGSGPSSPAEYEQARHVDPAVVADIADWLATALPGTAS